VKSARRRPSPRSRCPVSRSGPAPRWSRPIPPFPAAAPARAARLQG